MYDHVLIPTDGSNETDQAVSHGLSLARTYGATVHALYVLDESELAAVPAAAARDELRAVATAVGRRATADIVERAGTIDVNAESEIRRGTPAEEILDVVDERAIDLVVMGTHGRSGVGPDLGSTTLRVIRSVEIPALTVRFREAVDPLSHDVTFDDILIASDGSTGAMAAAEQGLDLAGAYGATVHAVYVVDTATYTYEDVPRSIVGLLKEGGETVLADIERLGRDRDLEVVTGIRRGVPSREILAHAEATDVDLLTLGAHGQTSEVHLGSTTERVIRASARPTLSVR